MNKKLSERLDYLERRIESTDKIVIWMKSGSQEIESEMGIRNLLRLIMDYLEIIIDDKGYSIVKKEKKGE